MIKAADPWTFDRRTLTSRCSIVLVDVDDTVTNATWREHLIHSNCADRPDLKGKMTKEDWDNYHKHCNEDPPVEDMCELIRALGRGGMKIIYLTSRPARYGWRTSWWLSCHMLPCNGIIMRPDEDDVTPSPLLKRNLIIQNFAGHYSQIVAVLDDREDICKELTGVMEFVTLQVRYPK